jgi:hypothetical protein
MTPKIDPQELAEIRRQNETFVMWEDRAGTLAIMLFCLVQKVREMDWDEELEGWKPSDDAVLTTATRLLAMLNDNDWDV